MWNIKKILLVVIACIMVISSICVCQKEKVKVGVIDGVIREEKLDSLENIEYVAYTNLDEKDASLHGEKVLEIIRENNNVDVQYVSVEEKNNCINVENVVTAIEYLVEKNVDVINMSLAFSEDNAKLKNAIEKANKKGILVIAASSNIGVPSFPAMYPEVIAISKKNSILYNENSIEVDKYGCTSFDTAYVTNIVIKEKLLGKKKEKIVDILRGKI